MRRYTAPADSERCECDRMPLADGSEARCMKRRANGSRYCAQHTRIIYGWNQSDETKRELAAGRALLDQ